MKKKYRNFKINKDLIKNSKYYIPDIHQISKNTESNTWFDITKYNFDSKDFVPKNINNDKIKSVKICKQIQLYPNENQKKLIGKWMECSRIVYNLTVSFIRNNKIESFYNIRKKIHNIYSNSLRQYIINYNVPCTVLDNAIHDVIKAYKTSFSLLKTKQISHFRIRYKKITNSIKTIAIEKQAFNKDKTGFFVRYLGREMKSSEKIDLVNSTCRLTYSLIKNQYILSVPIDKNCVANIGKQKICSIDPGNKTFLTTYSPNGDCYKIFNRDNRTKLSKLLKRRIKLLKLKKSTKLSKFSKAILKNNRLVMNLVKELHYKSALYLLNRFNVIYLGNLSTKGITSKTKKMYSFEKIYTYAVSHYKFQTILEQKAKEYNIEVNIVNEAYTTMTCGKCGTLNKNVGSSRIFNCLDCGVSIDRDLNGARNILIKNN